ncbi:MAG TPA: PAS domain S-box protein, partial [Ruminococcaceae bacterium]|nr:PAS domain S-box protein [Oscillospiraceae bacterium]
MSEQINNREYRQEVIKQVISELHQGKTVDEVKQKFEEAFSNVSVTEITEAEQALIAEGLPISEVQRLCDVHAAVFKGSIEEIHQTADKSLIPGHPANVLKRENQFIEHFIDTEINEIVSGNTNNLTSTSVKHTLNKLYQIDKHYLIKENLLFPYMEKYGITAPPKVMWGVDDEIRDEIKDLITYLSDKTEVTQDFIYRLDKLSIKIKEMIFKEE